MLIPLSLPFNLDSPDFKAFADKAQAKRVSTLASLGHWGTHLDRLKGTLIPNEYFKSRGVCLDVRGVAPEGKLTLDNTDLSLVKKDDFLILRTGIMERCSYASEEYMSAMLEVGWELLDAMLEIGPRFIGLDAKGLRPDKDHPKADTICEARKTFVIENLTCLDKLPIGRPLTVYAAVFDLGGTGLPVNVFADFD